MTLRAGVLHAVAGHAAAEAVGDLGLELLEAGVASVGADADHHVVIACVFKQQGKILGSCLEVGVDVSDPGGLGEVEAGLEGGAEAGVVAEGGVEEGIVAGAGLLEAGQRGVGGAVVDEQHAGTHGGRGKPGGEAPLQSGDVVFLVVQGHYDGEIVVGGGVHFLVLSRVRW